MIIGIDGNEANVDKKVGVSVYTFELLRYFAKKAKKDCQFIVFLKNKPRNDLPTPSRFFKYKVIKGRLLWSQVFLPIRLFLNREIDLFFSPAHYSPRFCPTPAVVTIHDLSYFYYPNEFLKKDLYQLTNWTGYSVKKAAKIIAVSKTTKKDLIKFYNLADEKIKVIYNGFKINKNNQPIKPPIKIKKPYLLFVGTIQPRKNLKTLIKAFYFLLKEKPQYSLIIAGKKGWLYKKIFAQVKKLNLKNKVNFTGYLTDNQLAYLYKNAVLFILPSLYEGFGLPLLEAMRFGCPVIASSVSSLPEIGGDACLYFNPTSSEDLKNKMVQLLDNQNLRKKLIKKGIERIKLFSWEKCGKETLKLLTTVKNENIVKR